MVVDYIYVQYRWLSPTNGDNDDCTPMTRYGRVSMNTMERMRTYLTFASIWGNNIYPNYIYSLKTSLTFACISHRLHVQTMQSEMTDPPSLAITHMWRHGVLWWHILSYVPLVKNTLHRHQKRPVTTLGLMAYSIVFERDMYAKWKSGKRNCSSFEAYKVGF